MARHRDETLTLLDSIYETAPIGLAFLDRDLRFLRINNALAEINGLPADAHIGKRPSELFPELPLSPSTRDVEKDLRRVLETGEPILDVELSGETPAAPGTQRSWLNSWYPVRVGGEVVGIGVVVREITERKREQGLHHQSEARYQRDKLADMGTLLAGVAHELNNPLAVVMGRAQLLSDSLRGEPVSGQLDQIVKAAERCSRIVRNFLALARQHPQERQPAHLNLIVNEAVELLAYPLRVDNVEVRCKLASDLPLLWADPHQLHQVIVNLITNAHQAMRESEGWRQLTLTTRHHPGDEARVTLCVANTGIGIPPSVRARMFEPFYTTKPLGQGTGLGLSLCRGIVEAHGGRIEVESEAGQGAAFTITLPVTALPEQAWKTGEPAVAPLSSRKFILVVDDETDVAGVLADVLRSDGHDVETAVDGFAALKMIRERSYDLILSDVRMPRMDGPELYRILERDDPGLLRRFVFLTGDLLSSETEAFLKRTHVMTLMKPFDFEAVRRVISRVIEAT